jgi:hypothetical protein
VYTGNDMSEHPITGGVSSIANVGDEQPRYQNYH